MFLPSRRIASVLISAAVWLNTAAQATILDLSEPWMEGPLYNRNKAYCTIQANLNPATRGYVVIQDGKIVAEGYNPGSEVNGKYFVASAAKSWSTMLIGYIVTQLGLLTTSETLGDIFNFDSDWEGVEQAAEKKAITVEEILTMTSGLVEKNCVAVFIITRDPVPQDNFNQVMNAVTYDACNKETWQYLSQIHILAQIILRRSGYTPRQLVQQYGIFTKMGIAETDYDWETFNGVEGTAYGIMTNPRVMAKLGQLYLQDGASAPGEQLISSEWVSLSTMDQLDDDVQAFCLPNKDGYGYQWYVPKDGGTGSREGMAAAFGAFGQVIVYLPNSNTTIAIMGEDGCFAGDVIDSILLETIIDNLDDLSVEETSCTECYSSWRYYTKNALPLLSGGLSSLSSRMYYPPI